MKFQPETIQRHTTNYNNLVELENSKGGGFTRKEAGKVGVNTNIFSIMIANNYVKKSGKKKYKLCVAKFEPIEVRKIMTLQREQVIANRSARLAKYIAKKKEEKMVEHKAELKASRPTKYKTVSILWGLWKKKIPVK